MPSSVSWFVIDRGGHPAFGVLHLGSAVHAVLAEGQRQVVGVLLGGWPVQGVIDEDDAVAARVGDPDQVAGGVIGQRKW